MLNKLSLLLGLLCISLFSFTQCGGCTKIVFIVDNSGSITTSEFTDYKRSMDSVAVQLLRRYPGSELSVIQYGSQNNTNHTYNITVPFTSNPATAIGWSRAYGSGWTVNPYYQDHLPGSLQSMRNDSIWFVGRGVDLITGGCDIRMVLFTDANADGNSCCSHLTNTSQATLAMTNFGEYNWHKTNFQSDWLVYHVTNHLSGATLTSANQAGAAIASKGGTYTGARAVNTGDPQGAGGPRKYSSLSSFVFTQQQIDTVLARINANSFSATFPTDTICLGDSANFNSNVTFPTSRIVWDFGDGTMDSTSLAPSHFYATAGNYNVSLLVWSADSTCKDTIVNSLVVHPPLVPDFLADSACFGTQTVFTNTTTGYIDKLLWKFGDGALSTFQPDTSHLYALPGVYPVTLYVNSSNICFDSITKNIIVHDKPVADFSVINECQFLGVSPTNSTTVITASLASLNWNWNFGDGTAALTAQNPTHSYLLPGTYTIEMIATTPQGCADTISNPVVIDPKPIANFSADTACLRQPTTFTDLSTVSSGAIIAWSWTIDGNPVVQNPVYTFPTSGTFPITVSITTDSGCVDNFKKDVIVRPLPTPDFNFSPKKILTFNPDVCFTNSSSNAVSYVWDFDFAGGTSTQFAPCVIRFPDALEKTYNVKLVAMNQFGCVDSIYLPVPVVEDFTLYAPNTFTPNDDGKNEYFKVYARAVVEFELFIFNRWGEEIFYSKDPEDQWDGKFKGKFVKQDTYVYRVIVKDKFNETREFHGHVNVLR